MDAAASQAELFREGYFERGVTVLLFPRNRQFAALALFLQATKRRNERLYLVFGQQSASAQHSRVRRTTFRVERQQLQIAEWIVTDRERMQLLIQRQPFDPEHLRHTQPPSPPSENKCVRTDCRMPRLLPILIKA